MSNHWNPKGSTGPTSSEGKAASSQNALKHGSCSFSTLILKNESIEDFRALEKRWFQGYNVNPNHPENEYEAELIRPPPAPTGSTNAPTATTPKSNPA